MKKHQSSKGNSGQPLARYIFSLFCTAPKSHHSSYNSVQCAVERGAGPLVVAAIAENSSDWSRQIKVKLISLFVFCAAAACASGTCSLARVDTITQYGVRVVWTATSPQPPTLQYHEIIWLPTATYVANGNSFGSAPNVVGLGQESEPSNSYIAGIIFNAPAATGITFSPISSDTSATTAGGVFTSANACTNVVSTFTTGAAQTFAQIHPTGPSIFDPGNSFSIGGTTWTEGVNCGMGTPSGATMMDCINAANSGSPTDGVLLQAANHVCTSGQCSLPSPPNPSSTLTSFTVANQSTATFTTATTMPFTNGQAVIVDVYGSYLPAPLVPGPVSNTSEDPVYYVTNISGNNFQLEDYTHTLVSTLTTAGSGSFYITAYPSFSTAYHVIDVQTSTALLPPPGVQLDPVAYGSALATVTLNNASISSGLFVANWCWRHTHFVPAATGSIADPRGVPELFLMGSGTGGNISNVVFDQDWLDGPTRPDRLANNGMLMTGAYISIQNSTITNMQNWVGLKGSILSATGSVATMTAGNNWYQGHNCTTASNLNATLSGSGAVNFYFDQGCNPTIAPGTGVSVSSAAGWTVLPPGSVTAGTFPLDSNSRWSVYPIGYATVTSGTVVATDANALGGHCTDMGALCGPSETGGTLDVTPQTYFNPPGPFSFINNSWDGGGVIGPAFVLEGVGPNYCGGPGVCPAIPGAPHDVYMHRNTYRLHKNWVEPLGSPWDFGWMNMRNGPELKAFQRLLVDGDYFDTMISDIDPAGTCTGIGNLQMQQTTQIGNQIASDAEIRNSTFLNCSTTLDLVGFYYLSVATAPPIRIWFHNNLAEFSLDPTRLTTGNQPYANGAAVDLSNTVENVIVEHNTWLGRGGGKPLIMTEVYGACVGCVLQDNIFDFTGATGGSGYADIQLGGAPSPAYVPAIAASGNALITATQSTIANNVWVPTWTSYNSGSPTSWTSGQLGPYESAYSSGVTFAPGSSYTATTNTIGWFNVRPTQSANTNFRLKSTSPYISGADASTDGLDIGANIDQVEAAEGKVSNVRTYGTTSTSTTVGFLAPDSFGCTVDWGASNFTTGSGSWTRVANAGGQRVQNVSLTGLPPDSLVYYRVNCAVQQPLGTVRLP